MKETLKKALKIALIMVPFAAIGGYFTGTYAFASYDDEMQKLLLEQIGSAQLLAVITMIQSVMYTVFCTVIGYILAENTGLLKSFKIEKNKMLQTVVAGLVCGIVFAADYWLFGKSIPQVATSYGTGVTFNNADTWIASVLYGGIVEELMLRFFLMSLVAWIIWKLFFKKCAKEDIPVKVFVIANILCAVVFAAGHLPATLITFGELTAIIVFRCFLMNGLFGAVYGELYRRYGIQYAMAGHMVTHVISKLIWLVFL